MAGLAAAIPVVVAAGVAVATQAPINAALGRTLGGGLPAAAVSFGVGCLVLGGLSLATGQARAFAALREVAPWQLAGGVLGAFFVWASLWGVSRLGAVTVVAALILGQMAAALLLDATGSLGLPVRGLSGTRVLAVALVAAGVALSRA